MYKAKIRFSGLSSGCFNRITGMGTDWWSDNVKDLYYHMQSLSRFIYLMHGKQIENCKLTFRIYDSDMVAIGDRFYYPQQDE